MIVRGFERRSWRSTRSAWLPTGVAALALVSIAPELKAQTPAAPAYAIDIPPKPLSQAVAELSIRTGLQVLYTGDQAFQRNSHAVNGKFSSEQALSQMLQGSGIAYRFVRSNAVTLEAPEAKAANAVALDTIDVLGASPTTTAPLRRKPQLGKTGTEIDDIPASISIVPRELVREQGGTDLRSAIHNVSGVSEGGASSYGFFDRFLIRGLDPRIYADGFSDGDQLNGFPHSLNGVDRIEVIKGPSSALFGSGPPGGTINIVHSAPSPVQASGIGLQAGSFGALSTTAFATGPSTLPGLDYRIDALAERGDGFRNRKSEDDEIRPTVGWAISDHTGTLSLDLRHIVSTPDGYGLIYLKGKPIDVSRDTKYSTPFSQGDQDVVRLGADDAWTISGLLTINNHLSYLYRSLDLIRNTGGEVTGGAFVGRQLRREHDVDGNFDYRFEPAWSFATGSIGHQVLTGFEVQRQSIRATRATADLPDITDIFAPVVPETSTAGLDFRRDAAHSGVDDLLGATYTSLYATDQVDLTDKLKLRAGVRKDWWDTSLTPFEGAGMIDGATGLPFQPGVTVGRRDAPVSWNAGLAYHILPGISPFVGVSKSHLANFNSEATDAGIYAPESALQFEAGVKISAFDDRVDLTAAAYDIQRNNMFADVTIDGVERGVFNDQRSKGVEADVVLHPTASWTVIANAALQDVALTGNPSQPAATGNVPIGVPRTLANLWTTYDFSLLGLGGFNIGGGAEYRGRIYADNLNTETIPSYVLFDSVLSYGRPDWDVAVGVSNITDVTYFTTGLGAGATVGDPRTFFAKLNYRF